MVTEDSKVKIGIGLNLATIFSLISAIVISVGWKESVDTHIHDESIHYELEYLNEKFTPRRESDVQIEGIKNQLESQDKKLDLILQFIKEK